MNGLHALEIECLARRMLSNNYNDLQWRRGDSRRPSAVRWLGVFARDELPDLSRERRPFALVLNTDPREKPGQHWLSIFGPINKPLELFDSFGLSPVLYGLDYLSSKHSRVQLQSWNSALCGNYCLYYLYLRSHNLSFDYIVSYLKAIANCDQWIYSYVNSLQRHFRAINPCLRSGQCCVFQCSFC